MIEELKSNNYEEATRNGNVIIDFWAPWCVPCKTQTPILEATSKEHPNVKFYKVNVDEEPRLASTADVRSIPTIVFLKNGEIIDKHVGVLDKEALTTKIKEHYG